MFGVEVCRILKEDPVTSSIPVIFISAMDECELKVKALEAGGTDFVAKPIAAAEILVRIKTHLKMYRLQKDLVKQSAELKREIQERRKMEVINNRFLQMVENSVNEIYSFDCETFQVGHFNHGCQKNLGYSKEELENLTALDLIRDYTFESFSDLVVPLRSGTEQSLVFCATHCRKDRSTYPVEIHLQLTPENPPMFLAIVLDVTERRLQEDSLRESENRFRTASDSAADCIIIWDQKYKCLYANKAAIEHVGGTTEGSRQGPSAAERLWKRRSAARGRAGGIRGCRRSRGCRTPRAGSAHDPLPCHCPRWDTPRRTRWPPSGRDRRPA